MTELTSKLEVLAQARGKEKLSEATKKHIRRKLEAEFGSILLIFPDDKGKLIVKNIIKRLTLAKILFWTFRQLLLPSSAGMKNAKI